MSTNKNVKTLAGRTLFITGASRGIGKAIALRAARDGANIVVAAKTAEANYKLPGTIYTTALEIESAGGKALPCIVDVRDENQVRNAVKLALEKFGGIDIVVNNASAISLTPTLDTEMKRFDLMHSVNTRGTFLVSKECLPHLLKSPHPHILNLSPPLNMSKMWFGQHVAYTMAKYGMSMCVLGMAEEFKDQGVGVNALWPRTSIHTAAMEMLSGKEVAAAYSRTVDIMADAAYEILCSDPKVNTGNFYIDDEVLLQAGVTDLAQYACVRENADKLMPDFFLDLDESTMRKAYAQQADHAKTVTLTDGESDKAKVRELFKMIEAKLSTIFVKDIGAAYVFQLKDDGATWFIDLKTGSGRCGQGDGGISADSTLTMTYADFFDLFAGKLVATNAFMTGKLKVSGDLQKAMKLQKLMGSLKSKL